MEYKLRDLARFDPQTRRFLLGTPGSNGNIVEASADVMNEVDQLLAKLSRGAIEDNGDVIADHRMLAAAITPPIERAVPYVQWTNQFFMDATYGDLEDNKLPVEDITIMTWQTHGDGEVLFTRPGYAWTRPDFAEWDTGLEVPWRLIRKAGWNVLERAMRRASEALALRIDTAARAAIDAAVTGIANHTPTVAGTMTKAAVDALIKYQISLGFPLTMAAINTGRVTDMEGWTGGVFTNKLPDTRIEELLGTFYLGTYGGVRWYTNVNVPSAYVYFAGPASSTGYHQKRGTVQTHSDIEIRQKIDIHTINTEEHAWYVGNPYNLQRLQIT